MEGIIDTPLFLKSLIGFGNYNIKGYVGKEFTHEEKNGNYISKHFSINNIKRLCFYKSHCFRNNGCRRSVFGQMNL